MTEGKSNAELGLRTFTLELGTEEASADAPLGISAADPPDPIQAMDAWASHIWHHRRISFEVLAAVPLWAAIRVNYRIVRVISTLAYGLSRPIVWLYWRLYALFGPPARMAKWMYWQVLFPIGERIGRASAWCYWRLYAAAGPSGRWAKKLYWGLLFPILEQIWRGLRRGYRKVLHPILEIAAKLLGFSLTGGKPAATVSKAGLQAARAEQLRETVACLTKDDAIIWAAHRLADFDQLFDLLPRLGMSLPALAGLFLWCDPEVADASPEQLRLLGSRLRSGAPFRRVWLYTPDAGTAETLRRALEVPVYVCTGCAFADFSQAVAERALSVAPSLEVTAFGPVVLLISALWGRVGSTIIFNAQTRFLIEHGAIVARVFVDHNPMHGDEGTRRRQGLIDENFTDVMPHFTLVAERQTDQQSRRKLQARADYRAGSGIHRLELELEGATARDADLLEWAGAAASLTIVNHAMHMAFAERISSAPIVLETHDVLTHQLASHGWPKFVDLRREPVARRELDQRDMWRRAKVCVNLSPQDHAEIAPYAAAAALVRPFAAAAAPKQRPWAAVVSANQLSPAFAQSEEIDVLLWGDWHEGNARAVQWALERMRPADPSLARARFAIVGRVHRLLPARLRLLPNVVSCGFVDSLEDFFARAKVLAIADQEGSGVSIKAIEAARYGRPFVSTPAGLRGLDLDGIDYTPAGSAGAFAADLAALLRDPDLRAARAATASAIYERNISSEANQAQWRTIVAKVGVDFATGGDCRDRLSIAPRAGMDHTLALVPVAPPQAAPALLSPASAATTVALTRAKHALAAVICTYDRYDVLPGAIESLLQQDIAPKDLEILVIDNSPDQRAAEKFGARYAGARVRYLIEPIPGLSNARNVGANACSAKYVAYIDDDAVAAPDWARKLVAAMFQFAPRAGVAGGRVVPRWITPRPDWLPDELIGNLSIVDWGGSARELGAREWIAGCNIAFERTALLELGGFSRALGRVGSGAALLSNEESDIIEKFKDADRSVIYVPEARVEHLIEPARLSQQWFRRRAAWQAVSDYIKDPKKTAAYASGAAERLRRELASEHEMPPGFSRTSSTREEFRRDVGLMYDVVVAMLAGGVELDVSGKSPASLQDKLVAAVRGEVQRNPQLRSAIRKLTNT